MNLEVESIARKKGREIASQIESAQLELAKVEQKALQLMYETVSENPPKALMAMIMPPSFGSGGSGVGGVTTGVNGGGGTIVGGWTGMRDAFRSEEFIQEKGSPCPTEFTLPIGEREKQKENQQKNQKKL